MGELTYLVLGPLAVRGVDGEVSPGGPTTRAVLANLLINANHAVSVDRLIYDVWGEDAGDERRHALHSHITRIRRIVGADAVHRVDGSYILTAAPDEIDAAAFEALVAEARQTADSAATRTLCRQAIDLWRGVPYADLADREFLTLEVRRLAEVRMEAIETCVAADLDLGRHREIVGSLQSAVSEFPFNERLWEYYLIALDRSGRTAEAVEAYGSLEALLGEELGLQPEQRLQELRQAITES